MAAGACGSDTMEPPLPPEPLRNEIVFSSDRADPTGNPRVFELYRMNADGSNVRLLQRASGGSAFSPSISPDGQWIAYSSLGDIWLMRADASEQQKLTTHPALDQAPSWSPDGTQIAFHSDRSGQQFQWDIFVMDVDEANLTQITTDPAADGSPTWAPDGSAISFWSRRDGPLQVYVSALDGQPPVNISNTRSPEEPLAWSPDGQSIAFRSFRDPNIFVGLYLMNPDGSNVRLVPLPFLPGDAAWKPDGSRMVVEEAEGGFDLWSLNPDGTSLVNLTNHGSIDGFPAWSP